MSNESILSLEGRVREGLASELEITTFKSLVEIQAYSRGLPSELKEELIALADWKLKELRNSKNDDT